MPSADSILDRPLARIIAFACFLGALAILAVIHWDDIFPPEAAPVAADDPVALCLAERSADIDRMQADGTISAEQASLFKSRAEALCQAQQGGGGPPPLPTQ